VKHVEHEAAKKVVSNETDGMNLSDAEVNEIGDDVASAAKGIALSTDFADREAGFDGDFGRVAINEPVGIDAEVAEDRDASFRETAEAGFEPVVG